MFNAIGNFWFNFYIQKVRAPFFGLTPLQQYIVDNYDSKKEKENPLLIYFYFLTYEKEVLDRAYREEKNYDVYVEIKNALMGEHTEGRLENTKHKMIMHMLSLVFIVTLMISASAVSTGKIMELWGASFGPYAYMMQGFFFATAAIAQWMIYRKSVPEVLKKFLFGKDGWHFTKHRELKIVDGELVDGYEGPALNYNKPAFIFLTFCSALLAISLGMIVLDLSGGTVDDGNVFLSMPTINGFAQLFGGVSNFGWLLCIASIACNFALFMNASIKYLFDRAKKERDSQNQAVTEKWSWTKLGAFAALAGLVVVNYFGLTATVMTQAQSTLKILGGDNVADDGLFAKIFYPAFTIVAGICGRGLFNIAAMDNLRILTTEIWQHRSDIAQEFKKDIKDNAWTYTLGTVCTLATGTVLGLSFVGETNHAALNLFTNANTVLPFAATLGASMLVFTLFKMGINYREHNKKQTNTNTHQNNNNNTMTNSSATQHTFTLKRHSERRSAQELFSIVGNSVSAGALAASSVATFLMYGSNQSNELKLALTILAMLGGGLMSMGSALNCVKAETDPRNKICRASI